MAEEKMGFDTLAKQRMEKDLAELQTLISNHFKQRTKDDEELKELTERIAKRKEQRAEQQRIRQEREKERMEREKRERAAKEAEEERRRKEDEERKKAAIQNMSQLGGAKRERKTRGRQTEREKKRQILAERRKPLNIDHLAIDKLKEKAQELGKYLAQLEEDRYTAETVAERQKYEITSMRQRINQYHINSGKGKGGKAVKTLANVGAKAAAFK